jgi:hypothetical protein
MVCVMLGSIERAEFAVNVANIRVINIAIDDVGHDFAAAATVAFGFRQFAPRIRKRGQFFQWPPIQFQRVIRGNSRALQNSLGQHISIQRNHCTQTLNGAH